jgi:type I restriction enzyme M protein
VTVERPLRATGIDTDRAYTRKEIKALKDEGRLDEGGVPVIRRIHQPGKVAADRLGSLFPMTIRGKLCLDHMSA